MKHWTLRAVAFVGGVALLALGAGGAQADRRYTVKQGDTLTSIARRFSIPLKVLAEANKAGDKLSIGQVLVIPDSNHRSSLRTGKRRTAPKAAEKSPAKTLRHVVRKGDTLYDLAKRYGVSVDALASANNAGDRLQIGQVLIIPKAASGAGSAQNGERSLKASSKERKQVAALTPKHRRPARPRTWVRPSLGELNALEQEAPSDLLREEEAWTPPSSEERPDEKAKPSDDAKRELLVRTALSYRGGRYMRGGSSPRGFDCSGFTSYLFRTVAGVRLPRTSREQFSVGKSVKMSDLEPGDLVFFRRGGGVGHVGVYIGGGKFIHASNRQRGIRIDSLNSGSYSRRFVGARRVLPSRSFVSGD
ncbi:MAG: NlpC/P60 family protein [Armatimonadota bacterium]